MKQQGLFVLGSKRYVPNVVISGIWQMWETPKAHLGLYFKISISMKHELKLTDDGKTV